MRRRAIKGRKADLVVLDELTKPKISRGVVDRPPSTLFERMSEVARGEPPLFSEISEMKAKDRGGITDELAKRKNRSWEAFKVWILQRTAEEIEAADPAHLARLYAPIEHREIAEVMQSRKYALRRARPKD